MRQPGAQFSDPELFNYFRRLALLPLPFLAETLGYESAFPRSSVSAGRNLQGK